MALFIENVCCLEREGALDHKAYARLHVTAPKSHGVGKFAMAARATLKTRVYVACARSWVLRSIAVRSITGSLGSNAGTLDLVFGHLIVYVLDHSSLALKSTNRGYDSFLSQFNPSVQI